MMNNLDNFKLPGESKEPEKQVKVKEPETRLGKKVQALKKRLQSFCEKRFGKNSKVTAFIGKLGSRSGSGDEVVDAFSHIKKARSAKDRLNSTLTIVLIVVLAMFWQWGLPMLAEADQLENDLKEQKQVIEIEEKNNEFLEKWTIDNQKLDEGIHTVYSAIPDADEKAEEVISMLENMAINNHMVIDAIGIRKMSESQMYYDDLIGTVDVYEYTFTLESTLPNILSFIGSLRQSLRLMDIMAMEIEENKGVYRASFLLNSYHLTKY